MRWVAGSGFDALVSNAVGAELPPPLRAFVLRAATARPRHSSPRVKASEGGCSAPSPPLKRSPRCGVLRVRRAVCRLFFRSRSHVRSFVVVVAAVIRSRSLLVRCLVPGRSRMTGHQTSAHPAAFYPLITQITRRASLLPSPSLARARPRSVQWRFCLRACRDCDASRVRRQIRRGPQCALRRAQGDLSPVEGRQPHWGCQARRGPQCGQPHWGAIGRSFNGRTRGSGPRYRGSNPCLPANPANCSILST